MNTANREPSRRRFGPLTSRHEVLQLPTGASPYPHAIDHYLDAYAGSGAPSLAVTREAVQEIPGLRRVTYPKLSAFGHYYRQVSSYTPPDGSTTPWYVTVYRQHVYKTDQVNKPGVNDGYVEFELMEQMLRRLKREEAEQIRLRTFKTMKSGDEGLAIIAPSLGTDVSAMLRYWEANGRNPNSRPVTPHAFSELFAAGLEMSPIIGDIFQCNNITIN